MLPVEEVTSYLLLLHGWLLHAAHSGSDIALYAPLSLHQLGKQPISHHPVPLKAERRKNEYESEPLQPNFRGQLLGTNIYIYLLAWIRLSHAGCVLTRCYVQSWLELYKTWSARHVHDQTCRSVCSEHTCSNFAQHAKPTSQQSTQDGGLHVSC